MKVRKHRGGFAESMATTKEVANEKELIEYLNFTDKEIEEVQFDLPYGINSIDERNGWNTYYVSLKAKGEEGFVIAGMSDGNKY